MVPPRDVTLEVSDELFRCAELVQTLFAPEVSVVALPNLVVVAKHAYTVDDVREPVFEAVSRARNRLRQLPQH